MTRIEEVMRRVKERINQRIYLPGTRVLSVRAQAKAMGVSVSTVVEAYERLCAEAVLEARRGSGFYVCNRTAPLELSRITPAIQREMDPLWVTRQSLEVDAKALRPGCGWLPVDWMWVAGVQRGLRKIARTQDDALVEYAPIGGSLELRQLLARRMAERNVLRSISQIILADSTTAALDLLCRFFLQPGDTVVVDDPCYFNFRALLRAHRVNVVGVPYESDGPDIEHFSAILQRHEPRLYITNSGLHNPTGAVLSPVKAHRVLQSVERSGTVIIEDDIFADFELHAAPRLAAFDDTGNVVQIGGFSKTISASARCGYIAGDERWMDALIDLQLATGFGSNQMSAQLLYQVLSDGGYRKYLEQLHRRLAIAREKTLGQLAELGIEPLQPVSAGMMLWCRLPDECLASEVAQHCSEQGVIMAPGDVFSSRGIAQQMMRFNVSQCGDPHIFKVLKEALARCCKY